MGLRDRAKAGLVKRLVADGIFEPLAVLFAEASYPEKARDPRLPRPIVDPRNAGRIIESQISSSSASDQWSLLARLTEDDGGARVRTRALAQELYGTSPGSLADVLLGQGAAERFGLER